MTGARIVLTKNGVVDYGSLHEVVIGLRSWIFGPSVLAGLRPQISFSPRLQPGESEPWIISEPFQRFPGVACN